MFLPRRRARLGRRRTLGSVLCCKAYPASFRGYFQFLDKQQYRIAHAVVSWDSAYLSAACRRITWTAPGEYFSYPADLYDLTCVHHPHPFGCSCHDSQVMGDVKCGEAHFRFFDAHLAQMRIGVREEPVYVRRWQLLCRLATYFFKLRFLCSAWRCFSQSALAFSRSARLTTFSPITTPLNLYSSAP